MEQADESGYFANLTLYDLYDCIKSTYHQAIAILGAVNKGENFIEDGERWGTRFNIAGDYYAGDIPRKDGLYPLSYAKYNLKKKNRMAAAGVIFVVIVSIILPAALLFANMLY